MNNIINFIINNPNESAGAGIIIIALLAAWNIFIQLKLRKINKRLKILFKGSDGKDLEKIIFSQAKDIKKLSADSQDLFKISDEIHKLAARGIQKTAVVRFNPFSDVGSDQSFSAALLDFYNNGLVISALYTREGTRIYSKPIKNSGSEYQLSKEEKEAIEKAKENLK